MANIKIESEFITAVLEQKIDSEIFDTFDIRCLNFYADLWEWLITYHQTNNQLPDVELVETRFPRYKHIEVKNDPKELPIALAKNKELDLFNADLIGALQILKKTGDVKRAKKFLGDKLEKEQSEDGKDVIELTSEKFTIGSDDFQKRKEAQIKGGIVGIPTGFGRELDDFTGGWQAGNLYGFTGITGIGKSWVSNLIAFSAMKHGYSPLLVALEGNVIREYYRLLSIATGASNLDIQRGKLNDDQYFWSENRLREIAKESGTKFHLGIFGDREFYTPKIIRQHAKRLKPGIIIVDYLTLMSANEKGDDNWESFLNISKQLAIIAASLQIPILGILQGVISAFEKDELKLEDIASSKGMARDFNDIFGITRVKGKQYWIKINSMKSRDGVGQFSAYYNTNWNEGKINFYSFAEQEDSVI